MDTVYVLYLPDLEMAMGANHSQGQGTGSKKEEGGRKRRTSEKGKNLYGGLMKEKSVSVISVKVVKSSVVISLDHHSSAHFTHKGSVRIALRLPARWLIGLYRLCQPDSKTQSDLAKSDKGGWTKE